MSGGTEYLAVAGAVVASLMVIRLLWYKNTVLAIVIVLALLGVALFYVIDWDDWKYYFHLRWKIG